MTELTVMIPFEPGRKLAKAYNKAMNRAVTEWVLFLDWDLFNCNPFWYDMCLNAIEQVKAQKLKTGWITCVTNRIGARQQRAALNEPDDAPKSHDILEHITYAKQLYRKYSHIDKEGRFASTDLRRIPGALSGFFILTNKTAWKACGGFDENRKRLIGVDNKYSAALSRAGYAHYYMPGLYFYHVYTSKRGLWNGNKAGFYDTDHEFSGKVVSKT